MRVCIICWLALVTTLVTLPAAAQERFVLEDFGWSCVAPEGWIRVEGTELEAIRSDLRQGPGTGAVEACWAMRQAGALPRILVTTSPAEIASRAQALALLQDLGAARPNGDELTFSRTSGLASMDGEVEVLTEGMVGARGVVQIVAFARHADLPATKMAMASMAASASFATEAQVPREASSQSSSSRLVNWGIRGAVIGAMLAVIAFGVRMLRALWRPSSHQTE